MRSGTSFITVKAYERRALKVLANLFKQGRNIIGENK